MDKIDKRILTIIQQDATLPVADIADRVGLSATPCWRRIQKLEAAGVVRGRVALLDPQRINLGLTVLVLIRTNKHDRDWLESFTRRTAAFPEVVEINRLAGDYDYILRVVVSDIAAYDQFYKQLIGVSELSDVTSMFSMEQIKYTTALPLDYLSVG